MYSYIQYLKITKNGLAKGDATGLDVINKGRKLAKKPMSVPQHCLHGGRYTRGLIGPPAEVSTQ
jgi:hypothetical protein